MAAKNQFGTLQVEYRAIDELRPNRRNARTHSKRQVRLIADAIEAFGFLNPIVVDDTDCILTGHGRLAAAKLLNLETVPTVRAADLTDTQKRAYVLADNRLAERAGWDRELLATELGELVEFLPMEGLELSVTGFDAPEIDMVLGDFSEPRPGPEDLLPARGAPVARAGEVWVLGKHRVLCGDSRSNAGMDRLLGDQQAAAVFTDPPYNVAVRNIVGRGRVKHREFRMASGEMSRDDFIRFLSETLGNAARVSRDGAAHYVCIDWRHIEELFAASRSVYGAALNLCVWNKTNSGQGSFYRSQHELIGVFRVGDSQHQNDVELGRHGRNRSNVWTYPGVNSFGAGRDEALAMHPTVKPVALVADALLDCTSRGELVLDPFLGSGTTIIAAEKIGRRCFGVDCDPAYVDVAIRRWQVFTKADAILEGDERTFDEIAAERREARLVDERTENNDSSASSAENSAVAPPRPAPDLSRKTFLPTSERKR